MFQKIKQWWGKRRIRKEVNSGTMAYRRFERFPVTNFNEMPDVMMPRSRGPSTTGLSAEVSFHAATSASLGQVA